MFNLLDQKYRWIKLLICLAVILVLGSNTLAQAAEQKVSQQIRIELTGVAGEVRENILKNLSVNQEKNNTKLNPARIRRLFSQSDKEISLTPL